jgi:hypothetical protein
MVGVAPLEDGAWLEAGGTPGAVCRESSLFKAYVLCEQLDRLWTYKTDPGVFNFLMGWFKALR